MITDAHQRRLTIETVSLLGLKPLHYKEILLQKISSTTANTTALKINKNTCSGNSVSQNAILAQTVVLKLSSTTQNLPGVNKGKYGNGKGVEGQPPLKNGLGRVGK